MKLSSYTLLVSALLAFPLALSGCDRSAADAVVPTPSVATPPTAPVAPKAEPTEARLSERVADMWKKKARKEWVETYDFLAPEMRKALPIGMYLQNKESHEYTNPVVHEVMRIDDKIGYVRLSVTWTPHHPQLSKVKLEPGQTLTQDLEIIETWMWVDGDWYQARVPQSPEEFFEEHPDFLKASEPK